MPILTSKIQEVSAGNKDEGSDLHMKRFCCPHFKKSIGKLYFHCQEEGAEVVTVSLWVIKKLYAGMYKF